jgi:hypothetical protein
LTVFRSDYNILLPRVVSYFDDIYGHTYNDFCGERLAISEFNHDPTRKICSIYGLRYFLPRIAFVELWPDGMFFAHFFEHPSYGAPDSLRKPVSQEIDGSLRWAEVDPFREVLGKPGG